MSPGVFCTVHTYWTKIAKYHGTLFSIFIFILIYYIIIILKPV